ncbi:MAG: M23 family metallopeptidase [Gemmatimonadales bacterium]
MRRIPVVLALAVVTTALVFAFQGRWPWRQIEAPPVALVSRPAVFESRDTLRRGETLADLFGRQGLEGSLIDLLERAGLEPRRLRAGLVVSFRRSEGDSTPHEALVRTDPEWRFAVRRGATSEWTIERRPVAWRSDVLRFEGAIESSLYEALDAAIPDSALDRGARVRLAWELADVYAWSVDMSRDIQPGDRFTVLVERMVSEEGEVRPGRVYAADLLISGKHLRAFRFDGADGARYFDADGNSLRRAFLRAPVEFRRISSNFSRRRLHPVLGIWRRHAGTDYSAASGTPVLAAGEGVVVRAGRAGGYGNLVEVRHRSGIVTRYGHLRGFGRGIRSGARVSQGQVIGHVGSTGLATAAHLHYEFLINGVARDSRRVNLGNGDPIARELRALFSMERDRLLDALLPARPAPPVVAADE